MLPPEGKAWVFGKSMAEQFESVFLEKSESKKDRQGKKGGKG